MTPTPVIPPDDGLLFRPLLTSAAGAVFGYMLALVTFRTRLSKMDDKIARTEERVDELQNTSTVELVRLRAEIEQRHIENVARLASADRRQRFTLRLMADVARKIGVDNRVDDQVIAFLTESEDD